MTNATHDRPPSAPFRMAVKLLRGNDTLEVTYASAYLHRRPDGGWGHNQPTRDVTVLDCPPHLSRAQPFVRFLGQGVARLGAQSKVLEVVTDPVLTGGDDQWWVTRDPYRVTVRPADCRPMRRHGWFGHAMDDSHATTIAAPRSMYGAAPLPFALTSLVPPGATRLVEVRVNAFSPYGSTYPPARNR